MATRRPTKNSGRLIPDNCYHGHGLCGARLQITATSCLHPYTTIAALLIRYFLKGFSRRCPYPRRRIPLSLVRNCVYRNVAEYRKLPSLLEAGKFMVGLCSSFGKYCFFRSVECVSSERREEKERQKGREVKSRSRGTWKIVYELVLPLRHTAEEGRVVITEIQWTLRNRRPFFFVDRLLESIVSYMSLFRESIPCARKKNDVDERPIRSLVNSFSRIIRHEVRWNYRNASLTCLRGKRLYFGVNDGRIYEGESWSKFYFSPCIFSFFII